MSNASILISVLEQTEQAVQLLQPCSIVEVTFTLRRFLFVVTSCSFSLYILAMLLVHFCCADSSQDPLLKSHIQI